MSKAQNGQSIAVHVDDVIVLDLPENASTGYRWSLDEIDESRLELIDSGFRSPSGMIAAGGVAFWSFRARSVGHVRIDAKKLRSWERDRSIIDRFSLVVEIEPHTS